MMDQEPAITTQNLSFALTDLRLSATACSPATALIFFQIPLLTNLKILMAALLEAAASFHILRSISLTRLDDQAALLKGRAIPSDTKF